MSLSPDGGGFDSLIAENHSCIKDCNDGREWVHQTTVGSYLSECYPCYCKIKGTVSRDLGGLNLSGRIDMSANNLYVESDWVIETFISCGTCPLGYNDFFLNGMVSSNLIKGNVPKTIF